MDDTRQNNGARRNVEIWSNIRKILGEREGVIASKSKHNAGTLKTSAGSYFFGYTSVRRAFNALKPVIQNKVIKTQVAA